MCLGRRLPISLIQQNIYPRSGSLLKKSQRYAQVPFQVAQQVRKSDFAGYWVYRDISVEACPQDADLVLFHLHGGGYVMGHPLDNATELLLIAEILTRRNYTVAIFSLEYTPAPRAPLPTQHNQALAAYAWLTTELHIDPSQLYLMGESAGGHLILSLLLELHRRTHLGTMKQQQQQQQQQPPLRKPAAAIMVSPWVNLKPCGPDARANSEEIDARSAAFKQVLERFSQLVLQGSPPETERLHGNFAVRVSERAEPLFRFDTEGFVEAARADGAQLSFELAEGREHVWQTLEARKQEKQFLAMAFGEDDPTLMAGAPSAILQSHGLIKVQVSKFKQFS
ncbi:hypothetical protein AOCH_006771 [Aspergillus ochraceoroseus]|uniref:Alpha/beta hydrolase fold-3 domain-containing protein n=1 Tax=Aspergillus ochraceoroseus TaxID=138278 RepID=A0A0F8V2U0_9EURO|nr:hypothetical protein AOCH_006771 [Aspergillus ochraceoroseus]